MTTLLLVPKPARLQELSSDANFEQSRNVPLDDAFTIGEMNAQIEPLDQN